MTTSPKKYSPEVRERALRMAFEHRSEHESQWAAMESIAAKIGCTAETRRGWVRQHERDTGQREGLSSADKKRIKALEREVRNCARPTRSCARRRRILPDGARPPLQAMKVFIDEHRHKALPIAPSTYYAHAASKADPELRSQRAKTDEALIPEVQRVWEENFEVYGVRKVRRQKRRERFKVARCTVQRLMKRLGLKGVIRSKAVRATVIGSTSLRSTAETSKSKPAMSRCTGDSWPFDSSLARNAVPTSTPMRRALLRL